MLKKAFLVVLYVFYAVALTLVLLVVRFPKDAFLDWAADWVERHVPVSSCTIDNVVYIYPLSVRFERIRLADSGKYFDIPLNDVTLTIDPQRSLRRIGVSLNIYGGKITSDVDLLQDADVIELPNLSISGIDLVNIEPLQNRLERPVAGTFTFAGRYLGNRSDLANGEFSGDTLIRNLHFELRRPILQSNEVSFAEVRSSSRLQNGLLSLAEGLAQGSAYDSKFSGRIRLAEPWQDSELEIDGELTPHQEYLQQNRQVARMVALLKNKYGNGPLPYGISGSFREPQFRFGPQ